MCVCVVVSDRRSEGRNERFASVCFILASLTVRWYCSTVGEESTKQHGKWFFDRARIVYLHRTAYCTAIKPFESPSSRSRSHSIVRESQKNVWVISLWIDNLHITIYHMMDEFLRISHATATLSSLGRSLPRPTTSFYYLSEMFSRAPPKCRFIFRHPKFIVA